MLKPAAKRKLPWMLFFLVFFLARVNAVTENICDSPAFDINESNVFWTVLLNTFFSFINYENWRCQPCFDIDVTARWIGLQLAEVSTWAFQFTFVLLKGCGTRRKSWTQPFVGWSVQLQHHRTNCRAGVFIPGGVQGGKIGPVAKSTGQSQKIQFLLVFVLWGFFSTDIPHEVHSLCPSSAFLKHGW